MKTKKFLSILLMLTFVLGAVSCGDDDDDSTTNEVSVEQEAQTCGKKFYSAYESWNEEDATLSSKALVAASLGSCYMSYKANKDDSTWKTNFILGIAMQKYGISSMEDLEESKYSKLSGVFTVLDSLENVDFSDLDNISTLIIDLTTYLKE